jgi:O-antigen biosynthesis protein
MGIRFCLDYPTDWKLDHHEPVLSGWCFGDSGENIVGVRAKTDERVFEGQYHLSRLDVAAAFQDRGGVEASGFSIPVSIKSGEQEIAIEAVDVQGNSHLLVQARVQVPVASVSAHIDTPSPNAKLANGLIRFSGWCCHPQHKIVKLTLFYGGISAECCYGLKRADVYKAYPNWSESSFSGFELSLKVQPGKGPIVLEALLENGHICTYTSISTYRIRRPPLWQHATRVMRGGAGLISYFLAAATTWKQHHRRWPSFKELPLLIRKAAALYRVQARNPSSDWSSSVILRPPPPVDAYDAWLDVNRWNARSEQHLRERLAASLPALPKLSVVMPVYNPPLHYFNLAVDSVFRQVYDRWELCIADDASSEEQVRAALEQISKKGARVRVVFRKENGNISRATNSAAALATGDFLVFLDNDDELTPDALGEIALYIADHPDTDFVYSDDDKIDGEGRRFAPQFKPDWSPELLLSYMYCSHVVAVRRDLFEQLGGMRVGFEGSQDYDFALRATEKARHVGHVPLVLYHWRVLPGSTAASGDAKPKSIEAGRRAVQEALESRDLPATVHQPRWAENGKLGIFGLEFPDEGPSLAIIIPTKNHVSMLRTCLKSLKQTTYENYRVFIIDNDSDDTDTLAFLNGCQHEVFRISNPSGHFNFAHINNEVVNRIDAEFVLFLNNDTEVREPRWLSRMMGYARIPGVGAVGARLLFADGRIQHAGIVNGYYHGMAGPAFKLAPAWDHGYLSYAKVARNYSAVTGACLLTPRGLFLSLGGFDAERLSVAYNDVDYCYRLVDAGYRCVYVPGAELLHHEGTSRGFLDKPSEEAEFRRKYVGRRDPNYSQHLSLDHERFALSPRRVVVGRVRPIRTFMTAFNLNLEGAPYSQFEMTVRLRDTGVIDPVVYSPQEGPLRELYETAGIEVLVDPHPLLGVFTGADYEAAVTRFARYIEETGAEIVYGNTLQTFYAIAAAKSAGIPSIWNPRESEAWQTYFANFGPAIATRALECFAFPYRVIFVAEATRDVYAPLNSRHNFTVIHNGLDITRLHQAANAWSREQARVRLGIKDLEQVVLLLGTVCHRKGQQDLPNALALVQQEHYPRLRCFIVGDRPSDYSRELSVLAARLPDGIRDRLKIVPECKDTALYYKAADIFLCTSCIESYPRVILEAMAYGLPIITTPVYGIKEQVRDNVNGLFYSSGDVKALADHITLLTCDHELRSRLALNSHHVLNALTSYEEMTRQYAVIFREAFFS